MDLILSYAHCHNLGPGANASMLFVVHNNELVVGETTLISELNVYATIKISQKVSGLKKLVLAFDRPLMQKMADTVCNQMSPASLIPVFKNQKK